MIASEEMPDLRDLRPFDSCVTLGRSVLSRCPRPLTAQNILEILDRYHSGAVERADHRGGPARAGRGS